MGVRGLSTFFNQNPDFFKPYKLHNTLVIVDGDNLIHALYFNNRDKISPIYGGDYKKYGDSVRKYLRAFLKCEIKPIIIFDGGYDKSGRKLKTVYQRANQRLSQVKSIAFNRSRYERILPLLAREVFISVLVELDVVFAVCDYEADDQITALANHYKCPIISADSDFFIYDVHKGFIRLDTINTTINMEIDSSGTEYNYLNCNIYHIDEFVCCFPGIDKSVLPLFGTLIGNDYIEGKEFDNFFSNVQLPKYSGKKLILNTNQKKMVGLLCWLKNNTLNEAVNHVMQYLKKEKHEHVKSLIESAVRGYDLYDCNLSYIIDEKLYNSKPEVCFTSELITPCGTPFPQDFVHKFHSGKYASFFINVIALHKVFLLPQIEDISLTSSYECAHDIRKIIYGILVRHNANDIECQDAKCLSAIEENERHENRFQKVFVEPVFSLEGIGMLPKINELSNLKEQEYLLIISKVLNVKSSYFLGLPKEWKLFIGCINYWLRNCQPHCTESFIYALILNLIYFSMIKYAGHCLTRNYDKCSNKKPDEIFCTCSARCVINQVQHSELMSVATQLKKYVHKPLLNHANPILLHIVHSYSQLQSVIFSVGILNKLLGEYVKNPSPHRCFSGTMLYNLTKDISTRSNAKLFIAEILGRETRVNALFEVLLSKLCEDVPYDFILKNQLPYQKRKKKSKKHFETTPRKESSKTLKTFEILNRKEVL